MRIVLDLDGNEHEIFLKREEDRVHVEVDGQKFEAKLGESGLVQLGGQNYRVEVRERSVVVDGVEVPFRIQEFQPSAAAGEKGGARGGRIKPPMPGKIISVNVTEGQAVAAGTVLVILEAMKMQNEITAPAAGTVKALHVKPGQNVESKDVIVELE